VARELAKTDGVSIVDFDSRYDLAYAIMMVTMRPSTRRPGEKPGTVYLPGTNGVDTCGTKLLTRML
jgi:hypothetical protein